MKVEDLFGNEEWENCPNWSTIADTCMKDFPDDCKYRDACKQFEKEFTKVTIPIEDGDE